MAVLSNRELSSLSLLLSEPGVVFSGVCYDGCFTGYLALGCVKGRKGQHTVTGCRKEVILKRAILYIAKNDPNTLSFTDDW